MKTEMVSNESTLMRVACNNFSILTSSPTLDSLHLHYQITRAAASGIAPPHFTSSLCATHRASTAKLLNLRRRESFDPYHTTRMICTPPRLVYLFWFCVCVYVKCIINSIIFGIGCHLNEGINVRIEIYERKDRKSRREFFQKWDFNGVSK